MKHTRFWSEILPGMFVLHLHGHWSIKFSSRSAMKRLAHQRRKEWRQ